MNPISISAIPQVVTLGLKSNATLEGTRRTPDFASTIEQIQRQPKVTPAPAPATKQALATTDPRPAAGVRRRTVKSDRDPAISGALGTVHGKFAGHGTQAAIPGCLSVPEAQTNSTEIGNDEGSEEAGTAEAGRAQLQELPTAELAPPELTSRAEPRPLPVTEPGTGTIPPKSKLSPAPDNAISSAAAVISTVSADTVPVSTAKPRLPSEAGDVAGSQPGEKASTGPDPNLVSGTEPARSEKSENLPRVPRTTDGTMPSIPVPPPASAGTTSPAAEGIGFQNASETDAGQPGADMADPSATLASNGAPVTAGAAGHFDPRHVAGLQQQQAELHIESPSIPPSIPGPVTPGAVDDSDASDHPLGNNSSSLDDEPQPASLRDRRSPGSGGASMRLATEQDPGHRANSDSTVLGPNNLAGTSSTGSASGGSAKNQAQTDPHSSPSDPRHSIEPNETKFVFGSADSIRRGEIHVSLQSETLGAVELRARVRGENVAASIAVEKKDTQQILNDALPSLHQALSDRKLRLDEISIRQGSSDVIGQGSQPQQRDGSNSGKPEMAFGRPAGSGIGFASNAFTGATSNGDEGIFDRQGRLSVRV